jgi:hypothetical protein
VFVSALLLEGVPFRACVCVYLCVCVCVCVCECECMLQHLRICRLSERADSVFVLELLRKNRRSKCKGKLIECNFTELVYI